MGSLRSLKTEAGEERSRSPLYTFTQREWLILALGMTLDDETESTKVHKYLYHLLRSFKIPEDEVFIFRQSGYGPSPEEPYNRLIDEITKEGLLKQFLGLNNKIKYYRLTRPGREAYKKMRKHLRPEHRAWLGKITEWFQTHDFGQVIRAVCESYPEWQDGCLYYNKR